MRRCGWRGFPAACDASGGERGYFLIFRHVGVGSAQQSVQGLIFGVFQQGIGVQNLSGESAGGVKERGIGDPVAEFQIGHAALAGPEEFTGAAQAEVGLRNGKTVAGLLQNFEAFHGVFGVIGADEHAVAGMRAASDAAA